MAAHLWRAALEKAEQHQRGMLGSKWGGTSRGELGLTIHDWVEVPRMANDARERLIAFAIIGWAAGALMGFAAAGWLK